LKPLSEQPMSEHNSTRRNKLPMLGIALGVAAILLGLPRLFQKRAGLVTRRVSAVMSTTGELKVFAPGGSKQAGEGILADAESALRSVEAMMSAKLASSALGRLNAAKEDTELELPAELMGLLRTSSMIADATRGAFDVTCGPILQAWQRAGRERRMPTEEEIALALAASGWHNFELGRRGVRKLSARASIDLGGIAKGFGIDAAAAEMLRQGATDGLVDVGGDVRCFGDRQGQGWTIGIQDPFGENLIATITISNAAVCTSGNYRRFVDIDGKRYSHIVDPRTGGPAEMTPSVTVVAPTATTADAWATALSVLGEQGLDLIDSEDGMEAMMVLGDPEDFEIVITPGFDSLFAQRPMGSTRTHGRQGFSETPTITPTE